MSNIFDLIFVIRHILHPRVFHLVLNRPGRFHHQNPFTVDTYTVVPIAAKHSLALLVIFFVIMRHDIHITAIIPFIIFLFSLLRPHPFFVVSRLVFDLIPIIFWFLVQRNFID